MFSGQILKKRLNFSKEANLYSPVKQENKGHAPPTFTFWYIPLNLAPSSTVRLFVTSVCIIIRIVNQQTTHFNQIGIL